VRVIVVDASVAVKLLVQEPGSSEALRVIEQDEPLGAPDWVFVEVASALWEKVKNSQLLEIHAERNLKALDKFFDSVEPSTDLVADALQLGFRLQHPVYDCIYLSMAVRHETHVVTADRRFSVAAERARLGAHVQLITW